MSIKKELKITAVLDDAAIKKQIRQLKQELNSAFEIKTIRNSKSMKQDIDREQDEHWKAISKRLQKEEREKFKMEKKLEMERHAAEVRLQDIRRKFISDTIKQSELGARVSPLARAGGALSGMARGMSAIGGGILGAGYGLNNIRRSLAEREFREVNDSTQGKFLEAIARRSGRSEFLPKAGGFLGGALAGAGGGALLGSALGPLGTLGGAAIGGIGGGIMGALGLSKAQGELRVEQIRPLLESFDRAKNLTPGKLQLMRGGGPGSQGINALTGGGAANGFTPEQTVQQLTQARGSLGNTAAGRMINQFQKILNATGADVGTQAGAAETFAGVTGKGRVAGGQANIEVIKRGVAAGLDISKSGKFLEQTAQFIQETAGLGRVSPEDTASRLSEMASRFSGTGAITDTNLSQARQLFELTKKESTATEGLAGIGNIANIQGAFKKSGQKLTPELLLALQNTSSATTNEDKLSILERGGITGDAATSLLANLNKGNEGQVGADLVAGKGSLLGTSLLARERGLTTEQQLGAERGLSGGMLSQESIDRAAFKLSDSEEAIKATKEFALTQKEAELAQKQVIAGFSEFDVGIKQASRALGELAEALDKTKGRLSEMVDNLKLSTSN